MKPRIVQAFTTPISLRFLEGQVSFWQTKGYDFHIICSNGDEVNLFLNKNSANFHSIPFQRNASVFKSIGYIIQLHQFYKLNKPTIVHGNTLVAAFYSIIVAKYHLIPKRIYEVHGLVLETASPLKYSILWAIEKTICLCSTHVIAVSPSLRELMIQKKLVSANKISIAHNGTCNGINSINKFNPANITHTDILSIQKKLNLDNHQNVVGFVGRLTKEKGIIELYQAWQIVKKEYPDSILLVIGGNDGRVPLSSYWLNQLKLDPTIKLVGHVEDIENYYALINFLVLPSYREGFGNVVLEAAAMCKPAIVSNITGLKDAIIENETGIFCKHKNSNDLAEKIIFYLQNPVIVNKHGVFGRIHVDKNFKPNDVWEAKYQIIEKT